MRSLNRSAFAALALASVLALYFSVTAAPAASLPVVDVPESAKPGGWSPAPARDGQVAKAARFALAEQARQSLNPVKLLAIKHVRQQQADGTHYSMNLLVQSEGQRRLVIAVVWTRPDGSMELTRWHWV